ncbi:ASCH domain-containing protein [Anaerobacillus isosaccharinicus]|uniref:ASCH domain-containing protein n=1 Tax=Anaerobacillus isosaccharinicus TaxID=1532552 RepID=A0A1S2LG39_9BACI|nr:ASCH domain-containing protein [Anaerobacillus isosaccharinicus]MBA5586276.1 ASCH domain-containing protein [Anaerobacillus isosaccharinicus]QOY35472.1 ASCH domain-containing protein [Anaerobacillus isosaccharinicus]
MNNVSIIQMWEDYRKNNPNAPKNYVAWSFGNTKEIANQLALLVLDEVKTATASNYTLYELEKEDLPYAGLINIILDGDGEAVAIAETISVEVVPFDKVAAEHAYLEGEGDRSLSFWRDVHETIFKKELKDVNLDFNYQIPVVCERFKVLHKKVI